MAFTTVPSVVTGQTYSAANYNTYVRDNVNYLYSFVTALYPVGSVYISVVATSPATLLGFGTWSAFGAGRTLVGIDAGQTEFDIVEETGGAKTHTLITAEMPAHTHSYQNQSVDQTVVGGALGAAYQTEINQTTGSTGGGGAHNNLQPYIVCYMWKRTA